MDVHLRGRGQAPWFPAFLASPAVVWQLGQRGLAACVALGPLGVALQRGQVPGVPKLFDLVSPDRAIIGDAKYYTLVRGVSLPPAKFSIIAEHVWLLEKTQAARCFLVFGNDARVPRLWLDRYGHLAAGVTFFFLHDDGRLDVLAP